MNAVSAAFLSAALIASQTPATTGAKSENSEPPSAGAFTADYRLESVPDALAEPVPGTSRLDEAAEAEEKAELERKRLAALEKERQAWSPPPVSVYPNVRTVGYSDEQCVVYVQRVRGDRKAHGYAGNLVPEGQEARTGAIAVFRHVGHVGIVIAVHGASVTVRDANWQRGMITEHEVALSDLKGFIY